MNLAHEPSVRPVSEPVSVLLLRHSGCSIDLLAAGNLACFSPLPANSETAGVSPVLTHFGGLLNISLLQSSPSS